MSNESYSWWSYYYDPANSGQAPRSETMPERAYDDVRSYRTALTDLAKEAAPIFRDIAVDLESLANPEIDLNKISVDTDICLAGCTAMLVPDLSGCIRIAAPELKIDARKDLISIRSQSSDSLPIGEMLIRAQRNILMLEGRGTALEERSRNLVRQAITLGGVVKVFSGIGVGIGEAVLVAEEESGRLKFVIDTAEDEILAVEELASRIEASRADEALLLRLWMGRGGVSVMEYEDVGIEESLSGRMRVVVEVMPDGGIGWKVFDQYGNQKDAPNLHRLMSRVFGNFEIKCRRKRGGAGMITRSVVVSPENMIPVASQRSTHEIPRIKVKGQHGGI